MRAAILIAITVGSIGARHAVPLQQTQAAPALPASQAKPLRRTFHMGEETRYRVQLVVRSRRDEPATAKTGADTNVNTVKHAAEARLAWIASERVVSIGPDGAARIREQLEHFSPPTHSQPDDADDAESAKLGAALARILSDWAHDRTLEFRVGAGGPVSGVAAEGAPKLDETAPPLLTLWLNHALRPLATLPEQPVRPGDSWQEPRRIHVAEWMGVQAGETDEWLEAPAGDRAAVRLHVMQEISGRVLDNPSRFPARSREKEENERDTPPPTSSKRESFSAESFSTLALDDGRLLAATRAARTDIVGPDPRRFRASLSVQVEIGLCLGSECEAAGNR